jgi:glutamate dehydrogenase (NAD(P)+)
LIITLREALKELGIDIKKTTASFQGFGNVSQFAVDLYTKLGGKAIAVSCWNNEEKKSYTYKKMSGVTYNELISITNKFGEIDVNKARELGYEILPGEAWIEQEVDILVPAALENQLNAGTVNKITQQ